MKKLFYAFIATLLISAQTVPVSAATVQTYRVKRQGTGALAGHYAYTDITWTFEKKDGKKVIKGSSAVQAKSGIMMTTNGTKCVAKADNLRKWSCKTGYVLGVQLPIGNVGYTHIWNDYITVYNKKVAKKAPVIEWDD